MLLKLEDIHVIGYDSQKITGGLLFFKTFHGFIGTCRYNELTKCFMGKIEMSMCDLDTEHSIKWQFEDTKANKTYTLNYLPNFHKIKTDKRGNTTISKLYFRLNEESTASFIMDIINTKIKLKQSV